MRRILPLAVWALACACGGTDERAAAPTPPPPPAPAVPPSIQAPALPAMKPPPGAPASNCSLDPARPGPHRRGGKAKVRITGEGLAVDAQDVPAICGALYNADVKALDVKAGEGLLFEACLPEGTVQINADDRSAGKQPLRGPKTRRGANVLFNRSSGGSFVLVSSKGGEVTVSNDLWKAEAKGSLRDVVGSARLEVQLSFDCAAAP